MPFNRPALVPGDSDRKFLRRAPDDPTGEKGLNAPSAPCLFEVRHGDAVIRVADDWDGHVLIETLYVALREARQARDQANLSRKAARLQANQPAKRPRS